MQIFCKYLSCSLSIVLQLVYWDDKSIYLEQQFVTLRDGFVRAVVLSRQNIVGVNVNDVIAELMGSDVKKPEIPEELEHWLKGIEVSSAKLRKSDWLLSIMFQCKVLQLNLTHNFYELQNFIWQKKILAYVPP